MFNKKVKKEVSVSINRTFASITAPLSKMVADLEEYTEDQKNKELELVNQKMDIDVKIALSKDEQAKATVTASNLKAFLDPTRVLVTKAAE